VFGRRGALVDQKNKRGETPLYKACMAGNLQSVRVLVKMNADASLLSHPFGISCLHWLFNFEEAELSEVVTLLTSQGARPSVVTQHLKDAKVIRHIPSKHFPFHWPQGTPIHWAAFARSCSAIDVLLQSGALVDELDAHDDPHAQTALSMATYRGDSMVVKHLLSRGADPCRLDGTGCSPAHMMAISSRKNRLLDMSNALRWWVYHGSWENHFAKLTECARALVAFGADLDIQTRGSDTGSTLTTPVLDAAGDKNPGALLALITAGASADCAISWSQETPIHRWAVCDSRSLPYPQAFRIVFEKLLTSVRSVDARDSNGQSLLHRAVDSPSDADFRYLTQLLTKMMPSISIKVTDADRCTPLLQAVQIRSSRDEKHDAVVRSEYLLSLGADTRVKGYDNRDYIWLVCQNDTISDSQCLGLLRDALNPLPVEEQRDLVRKSVSHRKGTTPLMCACNNSLFEVVCYLINLRADINALSKSGRTALDVALDSSAFIRQRYLNEWILERKLIFDGVQFSFNPRTILPADLLRSRGSFLQTEEAITQLFQRTSTENDLCEHD
jgi:ankyrin repeat protein